ncbi:hypothetical protein T492DRAFT_1013177 [Pavlovales sp. CCMP2436]|nr:hypothetical protein T492DRAFT_1013177 [Pavlovales sp. CCMP2436]
MRSASGSPSSPEPSKCELRPEPSLPSCSSVSPSSSSSSSSWSLPVAQPPPGVSMNWRMSLSSESGCTASHSSLLHVGEPGAEDASLRHLCRRFWNQTWTCLGRTGWSRLCARCSMVARLGLRPRRKTASRKLVSAPVTRQRLLRALTFTSLAAPMLDATARRGMV